MTGPEDAQADPAARDVAEALAWLRPCDVAPGDLDDWLRVSPKARLRAATVVRAALAAGPDMAEHAAPEGELVRRLRQSKNNRDTRDRS